MSLSHPSVRLRRVTASAGALAIAGMLALSGLVGGGVEQTEAAWSDTEVAQAQVQSRWMEGFTRVTDPGWKMRGVRDSVLPSSIGMDGPYDVTRNFALSYPQIPGTTLATGADDNRASYFPTYHTEIVPQRNTANDLWMGRYPSAAFIGEFEDAHASHCMSYPSPTSMTAVSTTCGAAANPGPRLVARQDTAGYTYSIAASGGGTKTARVNASGFSSVAQCFADGSSTASITESNSVLALANHTGTLNYSYNREMSIKNIIPTADDPLQRYDGTTDQWMRYNVQVSSTDPSYVLAANVRKNTFRSPYYALAEMDLIIQVYSAGGASSSNGQFIDQINLPLTRSECGLSNGSQPLPARAGTWRGDANQLGWPGRSLGNTAPTNSTRLQQFTFSDPGIAPAAQNLEVASRLGIQSTSETSTSTTVASGTTVTSPLDGATGTETSTSAPLDPSATQPSETATSPTTATTATTVEPTRTTTAQTTTVLTETPTTVIPGDPGTLSATAETAKVGTVEVDGTANDVVVKGDTVPTDADTAAAALDTWINDGTRPSGDWTTFTSTDPDSDGWRWAAINQVTGTVVYIR